MMAMLHAGPCYFSHRYVSGREWLLSEFFIINILFFTSVHIFFPLLTSFSHRLVTLKKKVDLTVFLQSRGRGKKICASGCKWSLNILRNKFSTDLYIESFIFSLVSLALGIVMMGWRRLSARLFGWHQEC